MTKEAYDIKMPKADEKADKKAELAAAASFQRAMEELVGCRPKKEPPKEKCRICGSTEIYKYDGVGPICEECAERDFKKDGPTMKYTEDKITGIRTFDITNRKGLFKRNRDSRTGDIIIDGKRKYQISKDGSFKRIDKRK